MSPEGFNPIPPQNEGAVDEYTPESEVGPRSPETPDFSMTLGEGFDNEFFADKLQTFPHKKMYEGWNSFLETEEDTELAKRTIETSVFESIFNKLMGMKSDAPMLFPVFIQGIQSYYKENSIPYDHVTPERMERFYEHMSTYAS